MKFFLFILLSISLSCSKESSNIPEREINLLSFEKELASDLVTITEKEIAFFTNGSIINKKEHFSAGNYELLISGRSDLAKNIGSEVELKIGSNIQKLIFNNIKTETQTAKISINADINIFSLKFLNDFADLSLKQDRNFYLSKIIIKKL